MHADPDRACGDDEGAIQPQGINGGATMGGQADDLCAIVTPSKVIVPVLATWVEERDGLPCLGIAPGYAVELEAIASCTGQAQVVESGGAAAGARHDVIDLPGLPGEPFGRKAIFAAVMCTVPDTISEAFRDFRRRHPRWLRGPRGRRCRSRAGRAAPMPLPAVRRRDHRRR